MCSQSEHHPSGTRSSSHTGGSHGERWEDAPRARDASGGASPSAWPSDGREPSEPSHPTRMAAGCQDATPAPSSSSPAAPTGAQWNARMGALPTLGSQSAHHIGDPRNTDSSLGSPHLHPSLPGASVQDVRDPTRSRNLGSQGSSNSKNLHHVSWSPSSETSQPAQPEATYPKLYQDSERNSRSSLQGIQDSAGPCTQVVLHPPSGSLLGLDIPPCPTEPQVGLKQPSASRCKPRSCIFPTSIPAHCLLLLASPGDAEGDEAGPAYQGCLTERNQWGISCY